MKTIKDAIQEWAFPATVLVGWMTAAVYTLTLCKVL